ncbi:unnamed protein product [Mytilus coruscus]|uniref:Uncharacterized protein n=1 Tax=Mytilus coruscus TaxID=42192 RepID=A0A6J8BX60_MYTCO|nr:unnamed protein product [Mytilus coruscus]
MLASNVKLQSIEEAVDKIRCHLHNHQAIYDWFSRKEAQSVSPDTRGRGLTIIRSVPPPSQKSLGLPPPRNSGSCKPRLARLKGGTGNHGEFKSEIQKLSCAVKNSASPGSSNPLPGPQGEAVSTAVSLAIQKGNALNYCEKVLLNQGARKLLSRTPRVR